MKMVVTIANKSPPSMRNYANLLDKIPDIRLVNLVKIDQDQVFVTIVIGIKIKFI
jgi:hypothetical protein